VLLRQIDERWPGVSLRIACNRYLAANPDDTRPLAAELQISSADLRGWLQDDDSIYVLGLSSKSLATLENYNKKHKKKKNGRPFNEVDRDNVQRIKDYGVEEYCDYLLRERRRHNKALCESAVARADTHS
jgi:hypothetical protein